MYLFSLPDHRSGLDDHLVQRKTPGWNLLVQKECFVSFLNSDKGTYIHICSELYRGGVNSSFQDIYNEVN